MVAVSEANYAIVDDDVDGAAVRYSLTIYSAIFAEVKGYFGITAPDNQLGQRSSCSLRIWGGDVFDNQPWAAAIKIEQDASLRRWRFI